MINDRIFENRLNAIKKGQDIPDTINSEYNWTPEVPTNKGDSSLFKNLAFDLYGSLGKISGILVASILYGYGIEAILGIDWEIMQILGIGFLFNHSLTSIPLAIKKLFTKTRV